VLFRSLNTEIIQHYISLYGLKVLGAIAIVFFGRLIARLITRFTRATLRRAKVDDTLVSFLGNITYALLLTFVMIAALSELGVDTTSLAAALAAAGLAIGLALQGSLSNLASGVMIIALRPFRIGDYVEAGNTAGSVEDINILTTTLLTPDNKKVIVPNSSITTNTIINYSANATRRLDMVFSCSYGDNLQKVKQVLEEILEQEERLLKDPAPVVAVLELADSSINFAVRPWVASADYWSVKFDITQRVKERFDEEGITIPFPQREIHTIKA